MQFCRIGYVENNFDGSHIGGENRGGIGGVIVILMASLLEITRGLLVLPMPMKQRLIPYS